MSVSLKLKPPECLPAEGVSAVEFKVWRNRLTAFVEQDLDNAMFLNGGIYSVWDARNDHEDGRRIRTLYEEADDMDEGVREINVKYRDNAEGKRQARRKLLLQRNSQISRFLQHIANYTNSSEQDDIINNSTSVGWIWRYLERHYDIETRGSKFLEISALVPKLDENPNTFYKQIRARVFDNLRKKNDVLPFANNKTLKEDEILTPTLECFTVLYALEKIDSRLPAKIQKDYGHRMQNNVTLIDLAGEIFQAVPSIIDDLNQVAELKSLSTRSGNEAMLNAAFLPTRLGARGRGRGGRGSARGSRGGFPSRGGGTSKFCRLCHIAGRERSLVNSHHIGECRELSDRDKRDFVASLKFLSVEDEEENPFPDDEENVEDADAE